MEIIKLPILRKYGFEMEDCGTLALTSQEDQIGFDYELDGETEYLNSEYFNVIENESLKQFSTRFKKGIRKVNSRSEFKNCIIDTSQVDFTSLFNSLKSISLIPS